MRYAPKEKPVEKLMQALVLLSLLLYDIGSSRPLTGRPIMRGVKLYMRLMHGAASC